MKRYKQRSAGFTLVELLVVITIIGMLMAMLLPAVNAAVEAARAAQCKNNIRNLTVAANSFEGTRGRYPGYREYINNKTGPGAAGYSWIAVLLPFLDHNDWYNELASGAVTGRYSELFVCPSDPPQTTNMGYNAYVINAGYWHGAATGTGKPGTGMENPADGIAHDFAAGDTTRTEAGPSTSAEYISAADGTSYTLMVSENVQDSEWYWGGKEVVLVNGVNTVPAVFVWHADGGSGTANDYPIQQINGRGGAELTLLDVAPGTSKALCFRPSSFHTGQVHASFCDSRTIVLRESIDYVVYQQLMTPNSKESNMADKTHVLSDSDYR